jgi:truncated hemoglobin YjbI
MKELGNSKPGTPPQSGARCEFVPQSSCNLVTELLAKWRAGDQQALEALVPLVYHELRLVADNYLRHERPGHTLQSTALVHEAAYWAEALGGPTTYSDSYGDETTVVKMHSGNGEHDEMNRRAIACFDLALAEVARHSCIPCCRRLNRTYLIIRVWGFVESVKI